MLPFSGGNTASIEFPYDGQTRSRRMRCRAEQVAGCWDAGFGDHFHEWRDGATLVVLASRLAFLEEKDRNLKSGAQVYFRTCQELRVRCADN